MDHTTRRAHALLDFFSQFTSYRHGADNPYIRRLTAVPSIPVNRVIDFLCAWWSFSRRTPQILLYTAASYEDNEDRRLIHRNYVEEDGMVAEDHRPHYDLLVDLIGKMGGTLTVNPRTEALIKKYMTRVRAGMSAAYATGLISGFEHPALDIIEILRLVVSKAGFAELLESDIYLTIHVQVEPAHIVWAHGNSQTYMESGASAEVLDGFTDTMDFWASFWELAMESLGLEMEQPTSACGCCEHPDCPGNVRESDEELTAEIVDFHAAM